MDAQEPEPQISMESLCELLRQAEDRLARCARDEFDVAVLLRMRRVLVATGLRRANPRFDR